MRIAVVVGFHTKVIEPRGGRSVNQGNNEVCIKADPPCLVGSGVEQNPAERVQLFRDQLLEQPSEDNVSANLKINKIELTEKGILVEWTDGHRSDYEARHLRINCTCAECVDEWTNRKLLDPALVPADIRAEDHLMVGRYAIQFLWSDAHYAGIYPLELLRSLCPCAECKAEQGSDIWTPFGGDAG